MDSIKLEMFHKTIGKTVPFPSFNTLNNKIVGKIKQKIAKKLHIVPKTQFELAITIEKSIKFIENANPENKDFSVKKVLRENGIIPKDEIIVWDKDFDVFKFKEFEKYFYGLWYPGVSDFIIFDNSLTWICCVFHYSKVGILRF